MLEHNCPVSFAIEHHEENGRLPFIVVIRDDDGMCVGFACASMIEACRKQKQLWADWPQDWSTVH